MGGAEEVESLSALVRRSSGPTLDLATGGKHHTHDYH